MVLEHNGRSIWTHPLTIWTEYLKKSCAGSRSVAIGWDDMVLPGVDDPHSCVDPQHIRDSEWDQKLGKIECVFSMYDKMRWKWDDIYVLRGLPNTLPVTLSTSTTPVSLYTRWCSFKMYLVAVIERVHEMHLEIDIDSTHMHLEAGIEQVWRYT